MASSEDKRTKLLWLCVAFQAVYSVCSAQSFSIPVSPIGRPIAVNPVTNKIYTGNEILPYVIAIDGATNESTKIAIGGTPGPIVVNPATNKIYVGFLAALFEPATGERLNNFVQVRTCVGKESCAFIVISMDCKRFGFWNKNEIDRV
jgi:hypothetical protein